MAYLEDGYQTLFSFSASPGVKILEKSVTPPGLDGGDAIDVSTMRNEQWRTFAVRQLISLTESTFTAAYDPDVYEDMLAMLNVNQLITITFPDGSEVDFWGALRTFTPNENTEGEQPTAECAITPTNRDDNQDEVGPVYRASGGY